MNYLGFTCAIGYNSVVQRTPIFISFYSCQTSICGLMCLGDVGLCLIATKCCLSIFGFVCAVGILIHSCLLGVDTLCWWFKIFKFGRFTFFCVCAPVYFMVTLYMSWWFGGGLSCRFLMRIYCYFIGSILFSWV